MFVKIGLTFIMVIEKQTYQLSALALSVEKAKWHIISHSRPQIRHSDIKFPHRLLIGKLEVSSL